MCISIEPLTDLPTAVLLVHTTNGSDLANGTVAESLYQLATPLFITWMLIVSVGASKNQENSPEFRSSTRR